MATRAFGHVRKLPSGLFQASYVGPDSNRHNAPHTFKTKTEARDWLAVERSLIVSKEWTDPGETEPIQTAVNFKEYAMRHIEVQTNEYRELLRESTKAYTLLSAVMKRAVDESQLPFNPCKVKGAQSATTGRAVTVPTSEDVAAIVENINPRYWNFVFIKAYSGLRFGEIAGGKVIKFFDKSYVSVSAWGAGEPEKLIDVTATADFSNKTGLGRAVVGVATVGLNIVATSNMRGDIYVSIVTEKTTHVIHLTQPSERSVKTARKIEATGKGLVSRLNQIAHTQVASTPERFDIAEQLAKIVDLHASGVLSDEDFSNAKAKIIG